MADNVAHRPEAVLPPPDRRQALQAVQRIHRGTLGLLAQRVNIGHLVQAQHLRLAFGEGDTLAIAVVKRDKYGCREGHDPRLLHAICRSNASQELLHLRGLLAARQIGPPQPEQKLKQDGRAGSCGQGGRFRGRRFSAHDACDAFRTTPSARNGTNLRRVSDVGRPSRLPACGENSRRDACSTPLKLAPFPSARITTPRESPAKTTRRRAASRWRRGQ